MQANNMPAARGARVGGFRFLLDQHLASNAAVVAAPQQAGKQLDAQDAKDQKHHARQHCKGRGAWQAHNFSSVWVCQA